MMHMVCSTPLLSHSELMSFVSIVIASFGVVEEEKVLPACKDITEFGKVKILAFVTSSATGGRA